MHKFMGKMWFVKGGDEMIKDSIVSFLALLVLTVCIGFFTGVFYGVFKAVANFIV